jgi:hypothetical protein
MRDIRSDLEERAHIIEEQLKAALPLRRNHGEWQSAGLH